MKALRTFTLFIFFAAIACQPEKEDKKAKLEKLKKEAAALQAQISSLEQELSSTDTIRDKKVRMVEVKPLTHSLFNNYIDVQGKVDAEENVAINAEMPGIVTRILVEPGDKVSKGQVLAEMDSKVIQQSIAEVQSSLDLAKTMYEKQKNLWEQQIGTEVQYLAAKNQKESLEKRLATMYQQLQMSKLTSPINGTVDDVDIKVGQAVMPGIPAMRVVNMSNLEVKAEVAESYAPSVESGNPVKVIFPDMKDTVNTKISYASTVISPLNRTFSVIVDLNGKKEYHPNMIAILKIVDYSNPKAIVIPANTIQHSEEGDFVFIASSNKAKKVKVEIGKTYNGNAEIRSGLKEGDQLITKGFQDLNEGEEIKF